MANWRTANKRRKRKYWFYHPLLANYILLTKQEAKKHGLWEDKARKEGNK